MPITVADVELWPIVLHHEFFWVLHLGATLKGRCCWEPLANNTCHCMRRELFKYKKPCHTMWVCVEEKRNEKKRTYALYKRQKQPCRVCIYSKPHLSFFVESMIKTNCESWTQSQILYYPCQTVLPNSMARREATVSTLTNEWRRKAPRN